MKRRLTQVLMASAVAAAAVLLTSGSASADGQWQSLTVTPRKCSPTKMHDFGHSLYFQTCIIVSPNNQWAQAITVVSNQSGSNYAIDSTIESNYYFDSKGRCRAQVIRPKTRLACFGETILVYPGDLLESWSDVFVDEWFPDRTATARYKIPD